MVCRRCLAFAHRCRRFRDRVGVVGAVTGTTLGCSRMLMRLLWEMWKRYVDHMVRDMVALGLPFTLGRRGLRGIVQRRNGNVMGHVIANGCFACAMETHSKSVFRSYFHHGAYTA